MKTKKTVIATVLLALVNTFPKLCEVTLQRDIYQRDMYQMLILFGISVFVSKTMRSY